MNYKILSKNAFISSLKIEILLSFIYSGFVSGSERMIIDKLLSTSINLGVI